MELCEERQGQSGEDFLRLRVVFFSFLFLILCSHRPRFHMCARTEGGGGGTRGGGGLSGG